MAKLKDWKPGDWEGDLIVKRPYKNREDYEENQRAAFLKRKKAIARFNQDVKRFTSNSKEIHFLKDKKVLCLGCRSGAEVMAMINLGNTAVGVDLEPVVADDEAEKHVMQGDFHDLHFVNNWFDVVYTNSYDHCFDLPKALSEVKRVLKDDGHFILEVVAGYGEGGCPGDHEAMYWKTAEDFVSEVEQHGFKRIQKLQQVPYVKGQPFKRAILKIVE